MLLFKMIASAYRIYNIITVLMINLYQDSTLKSSVLHGILSKKSLKRFFILCGKL